MDISNKMKTIGILFFASLVLLNLYICQMNLYSQKLDIDGNEDRDNLLFPINSDGKPTTSVDLLGTGKVVLFIHSKCPSCDRNLYYFEKIAKVEKANVVSIGIVLSTLESSKQFVSIKNPKYKVYRPENSDWFIKKYDVDVNSSYILLFQNGQILYRKNGRIGPQDYFDIKKLIQGGANDKISKNSHNFNRRAGSHSRDDYQRKFNRRQYS